MATKKEITNFAKSSALKAAMLSKGIYPKLEPDMACYDGAANDKHLLHGDALGDGSLRTVNVTTQGVSFDFVDKYDPALVRIWSKRELDGVIADYPNVQSSEYTFNGTIYTHTI